MSLTSALRAINRKNITLYDVVYEINVMTPPGASSWNSRSSYHVVLFARLENPQFAHRWVIFKFALADSIKSPTKEVICITKKMMAAMQNRYQLLEKYCAEFAAYNSFTRGVLVNKPFILTVGDIDVWMEEYIPNFQKFWGNFPTLTERLVTSSSSVLSSLQYFIYQKSVSVLILNIQLEIETDGHIHYVIP